MLATWNWCYGDLLYSHFPQGSHSFSAPLPMQLNDVKITQSPVDIRAATHVPACRLHDRAPKACLDDIRCQVAYQWSPRALKICEEQLRWTI